MLKKCDPQDEVSHAVYVLSVNLTSAASQPRKAAVKGPQLQETISRWVVKRAVNKGKAKIREVHWVDKIIKVSGKWEAKWMSEELLSMKAEEISSMASESANQSMQWNDKSEDQVEMN